MGIIKKGITKAVTKGLGVKKQALTATGAKTVVKEGAKNVITGGATKSVGKVTQYQAKAQKLIDKGLKAGLEEHMIERLGTLSATELVKSAVGLKQLEQKMKFIHQLPKILKEIDDYEKKLYIKQATKIIEKQYKDAKAKYGDDAIARLQRDNNYRRSAVFKTPNTRMKTENLKNLRDELKRDKSLSEKIEEQVTSEIDDFVDRYFKEISCNGDDVEKLEHLKNLLCNNIADYRDFVDYVTTNATFTKRFYDREDIDGYVEEMRDRLDRMIDLAETGAYK